MVIEVKLGVFGSQADFVEDKTPFLAFIAGRGSGKTYGGAVKALGLAGEQKVNGMITAPTYPMLRDSTMLTCLNLWPRTMIAEHSKSEMTITLTNGSVCRFRSTDDPDKLRGPNTGFIWMDEPAQSSLEAWQILLGTLREPPGVAFLTGTPRGYNWVYQEFVAKVRANYKLIRGRSQDNKHNPPEFVQWLRESYQNDFALQEIEGEFILVGGQCYFDIANLKRLLEESREETTGNYKKPVITRRYAAWIDPAGMGKDRHSLSIMDCQTGEMVVDWTNTLPRDEFALGAHKILITFGSPLLGIESNGVGEAMIDALIKIGYPPSKLCHHGSKGEKLGVPSSQQFRDRILPDLAEGIRQGSIVIYSRGQLDECFSFLRTEKGRPEAASGAFDDRVMSMAGANWVSKQVFTPIKSQSYAYARL